MCGIIGILGKAPVAPLLLDGLKRLEYRGYDSAGIATLVNGHIDRRRAEGKLVNLAALLDRAPLEGTVGIGHTRWATHDRPNETNAHPHATGRAPLTRRICYLEEDDWAVVRADGATIHHGDRIVDRPIKQTALSGALIGKGDYRHFMLKEIHEQPAVVGDTLRALVNPLARRIEL